jgi:hypothetical protein
MQLKGIELSVSSDFTKEMGLLKAKVETIRAKKLAMNDEIAKAIVHFKVAKALSNRVAKMKEKYGIEPKELNAMSIEMEKMGEYLQSIDKL